MNRSLATRQQSMFKALWAEQQGWKTPDIRLDNVHSSEHYQTKTRNAETKRGRKAVKLSFHTRGNKWNYDHEQPKLQEDAETAPEFRALSNENTGQKYIMDRNNTKPAMKRSALSKVNIRTVYEETEVTNTGAE